MAKKAVQSVSSHSKSFTYYHIAEDDRDFSKECNLDASFVKVLNYFQLNSTEAKDPLIYGCATGLYYVWKNETSDYIGFSMNDAVIDPSVDLHLLISKNNADIIIPTTYTGEDTLIEEYDSSYYGHDIRALLSCLKDLYPSIYDTALKDVLRCPYYIPPAFVMRKEVFRKCCLWIFALLDRVAPLIPKRVSAMQQKAIEHLFVYAFNIWIYVYKDKYKTDNSLKLFFLQEEEFDIPPMTSLLSQAQFAVDSGKPEEIAALIFNTQINPHDDTSSEFEKLKVIYQDYLRQKRYYVLTELDEVKSITTLASRYTSKRNSIKTGSKRVLFFSWNAWNTNDYINALKEMGFEVIATPVCTITSINKLDYADVMKVFIKESAYDFIFSVNYMEPVAMAANVLSIPYIAWNYDSPVDLGKARIDKCDTSYVFFFDSVEAYKHSVIKRERNAYYMPLPAAYEKYDSMKITSEDRENYSADISFVGQMYQSRLNDYLNYLSDYKKGFVNGLIDANLFVSDNKRGMWEVIDTAYAWLVNEERFRKMVYEGEKGKRPEMPSDSVGVVASRIANMSERTITMKERVLLTAMLSRHHSVKLYSQDSHAMFENVSEGGTVDYDTEMPKVFKCSKINLNITLHSIEAGIPLRCIDIMACHGFLLSNWQKDFDEHFKDGENVALFNSIEEAVDKCDYYLKHEAERQKVSDRGYETVRKYYSFDALFRRIFKTAGLDYLLS